MPPDLSFSIVFSVSAIIPQELLSSVSLHISLADSSSPTIFNVHPAFSLHRLASLSVPVLIPPSLPPVPTPSNRPPSTMRHLSKAPLPRSATPSRSHLQIWSRVTMRSALQSALATNIHQHVQPSALTVEDSAVPRLPPLAFGGVDLIGEIFSTSHFELGVDGSSSTSQQARHERTYSVPSTASQVTFAGSTPVFPYFQNMRPHLK
jgi:hypothetical protein